MRALIDGDVIKYACGFACQKTVFKEEGGDQLLISQIKGGMQALNLETKKKTDYEGLRSKAEVLEKLGGEWTEEVVPEPVEFVGHTVKMMLGGILKATGAKQYTIFLSKGDCFRVGVYPEYKASRKFTPKPHHVQTIEDYFVENHDTIISEEIEADDAMGIHQTQALNNGTENTIICSLDKDMDMIPGLNYKWNSKKIRAFSEAEAMHSFWIQTLTGDSTDDIPGIPGVGNKTAAQMLENATPGGYKKIVLEEYSKIGWSEDILDRNARLLWILRKPLQETYGMNYSDFFGDNI